MPGNDLTAQRALVPVAGDTRAVARAQLTTLLTDILDDIEPKVTAAQININSDLSFLSGGTYSALTTAGYVSFEDRSTDTAAVESIYTKSDELWYHDGAGNKVQLTSGGAAVAGSGGDITGAGYGSTGVEINWDAGTAEYRFKRGAAATDLADLVMDKARFSDGAGTDYATLGAQSGMSGVVDFSLPLAVPASTTDIMTMDTSGNMAHTPDPSVTSLTATGDVTADDLLHTGNRVLYIGPAAWHSSANGNQTLTGQGVYRDTDSSAEHFCTIPLTAGDEMNTVTVWAQQSAVGTLTASLHTISDAGTLSTSIDSATWAGAGSFVSLAMTGLTETLSSGTTYVIRVESDAVATVSITNTYITYTRT